mmetsp:Transcript_28118/g.64578  ORF Transcript_28118/g.64578 Transcript_28118/m.64578 type:complete len:489 (+) Transcript_28118:2011-3477(+)
MGARNPRVSGGAKAERSTHTRRRSAASGRPDSPGLCSAVAAGPGDLSEKRARAREGTCAEAAVGSSAKLPLAGRPAEAGAAAGAEEEPAAPCPAGSVLLVAAPSWPPCPAAATGTLDSAAFEVRAAASVSRATALPSASSSSRNLEPACRTSSDNSSNKAATDSGEASPATTTNNSRVLSASAGAQSGRASTRASARTVSAGSGSKHSTDKGRAACTAACAFPPAGLTDAGAPAGAPGLLPSAAGLPDWSAAGLPDWTAAGFPDWAAAAGLPDWRAAAGLASSSSELDSSPGPPAPSARMPPVPPASATAPPTAPPWAGAAGEGTSGERMARARLACACSPRAATTAAAAFKSASACVACVEYGGQRSSPSKLTSGDSPGIGIAGLAGLPTAPGLNTRAPGLGSGAGSASTRATCGRGRMRAVSSAKTRRVTTGERRSEKWPAAAAAATSVDAGPMSWNEPNGGASGCALATALPSAAACACVSGGPS